MLIIEKRIRLWHIKYNEILIQRVPLWVLSSYLRFPSPHPSDVLKVSEHVSAETNVWVDRIN